MSRIEIDSDTAFRQAGITADHYLNVAIMVLKEKNYEWELRDAVELAKIMATDYDTTMTCIKMQEIESKLHEISYRISVLT